MSNAPGTLARVLLALSDCSVNIVQGRSITLDDDKRAGYIAELEVPLSISDEKLLKHLKAAIKDLIYDLQYMQ
jgi:ACT domain-containing protein